jgi:hypothetical protein
MALARATPGTKLHKHGCLGHQTRRAANTSDISFIGGWVLTLLNVASPLSQSRRAESRPLVPHVNFIQLNGKLECVAIASRVRAQERTLERKHSI